LEQVEGAGEEQPVSPSLAAVAALWPCRLPRLPAVFCSSRAGQPGQRYFGVWAALHAVYGLLADFEQAASWAFAVNFCILLLGCLGALHLYWRNLQFALLLAGFHSPPPFSSNFCAAFL